MLSSKEIAYLVSISNDIKPVAQIGKEGVTQKVINDLMNYLRAHELMKISILNNCMQSKEEITEALQNADINIVKLIGKTLIVYKKNPLLKNGIKL